MRGPRAHRGNVVSPLGFLTWTLSVASAGVFTEGQRLYKLRWHHVMGGGQGAVPVPKLSKCFSPIRRMGFVRYPKCGSAPRYLSTLAIIVVVIVVVVVVVVDAVLVLLVCC